MDFGNRSNLFKQTWASVKRMMARGHRKVKGLTLRQAFAKVLKHNWRRWKEFKATTAKVKAELSYFNSLTNYTMD